MVFTILFASNVLDEDVPKLATETQDRIQDAIGSKLKTNPAVFGKPLRQSLKNHRSLRVGDFRIVYRIDEQLVRIVAIRHRRDVYKVAGNRV